MKLIYLNSYNNINHNGLMSFNSISLGNRGHDVNQCDINVHLNPICDLCREGERYSNQMCQIKDCTTIAEVCYHETCDYDGCENEPSLCYTAYFTLTLNEKEKRSTSRSRGDGGPWVPSDQPSILELRIPLSENTPVYQRCVRSMKRCVIMIRGIKD